VLAGGDLAPEGVVAPGELDDVDVEGFGHDRSSVGAAGGGKYLPERPVDFTRERFGGVCSHREIDRITEAAKKAKADVVVGIGDGTTLDTAKAARHQAGIAWRTGRHRGYNEFVSFCMSVGLPTTFADLDLGG
jgi:glycerol dehydrogenase-like iron-containing ADH family enzyme